MGLAALKLFASLPDWDVLVLSRRRPPTLFNARFVPADLMDENACAELADQLRGLTHVVYTALHERPELIAGCATRRRSAQMTRCSAICLQQLKRLRQT